MSREQNEKITDGARGLYEKYTGYVVMLYDLQTSWTSGVDANFGKTERLSTQSTPTRLLKDSSRSDRYPLSGLTVDG